MSSHPLSQSRARDKGLHAHSLVLEVTSGIGVGDWDSEVGKEGSSCKDTFPCWSALWSVGFDPAGTVWKVLYKLHLRITHQPPASISRGCSMGVKTSMHFQDVHAQGLGIPAAIPHPMRGLRAAPGQKVSKAQGSRGRSHGAGWSSSGWRKVDSEAALYPF